MTWWIHYFYVIVTPYRLLFSHTPFCRRVDETISYPYLTLFTLAKKAVSRLHQWAVGVRR
jgi:hypothetical protein